MAKKPNSGLRETNSSAQNQDKGSNPHSSQYKAILIWCFILTIEKVTGKVKTPGVMQ